MQEINFNPTLCKNTIHSSLTHVLFNLEKNMESCLIKFPVQEYNMTLYLHAGQHAYSFNPTRSKEFISNLNMFQSQK